MKLFGASDTSQQIFKLREHQGLPEELPVAAVVLAPRAFFEAPGAKRAAVGPAATLIAEMRERVGIDVRLATWDADRRALDRLAPTEHPG